MPRTHRVAEGGLTYHVLNRANGRPDLFERGTDYALFESVLAEARQKWSMRVVAYCIMPDHWHLVVAPRADGQLSAFMRWLTLTHAKRWHARHRSLGSGHVYRGGSAPSSCSPVARCARSVATSSAIRCAPG